MGVTMTKHDMLSHLRRQITNNFDFYGEILLDRYSDTKKTLSALREAILLDLELSECAAEGE